MRIALAGAGDRGGIYANWIAAHPVLAVLVAVAEPDADRRERLAGPHGASALRDWRELLAVDCDAVLVCTQDREHVAVATAFLEAGRHVLCEKPMAPTADECRALAAVAERSPGLFTVAHVLRYTPHSRRLRDLLDAGLIGRVQSVQHTEPIGWYHFAHSYVRGNWASEATSGPLLLTKSCHDIDWLSWMVGPIRKVASFGSLAYFTPEHAPAAAADRCLDCVLERECAYSATRIYLDAARAGQTGWPVSVITTDPGPAGVERALRDGPYGRCAWRSGNTVVDRQVVALEFDGGVTGTFQLLPFTDKVPRRTQFYGEFGELTTDGTTIDSLDFRTGRRSRVVVDAVDQAGNGHGGGDWALLDAFVDAIRTGRRDQIHTGAAETLASHLAVFEIERARRTGTVVELA